MLQNAWYSQRNKDICKRAFDLAVVATLAVPAALLIIPTGLTIMACSNGQSPLFVQERIGYKGKPFDIYKLRTYDDDGNVLSCAKTIRALKLDELPQLWNIAKGDMSIIGPRPHVSSDPIAHLWWRQSEKPGLTSEAKIKGGNHFTHAQQAVLERYTKQQCDKMSVGGILAYNFRIALETPVQILRNLGTPTSYDAAGHSKDMQFGKGERARPKPMFPFLRQAA